jgi:hypothetical protein
VTYHRCLMCGAVWSAPKPGVVPFGDTTVGV